MPKFMVWWRFDLSSDSQKLRSLSCNIFIPSETEYSGSPLQAFHVGKTTFSTGTTDSEHPSTIDTKVLTLQNEGQIRDIPVLKNTEKVRLILELFLDYGADDESATEFLLSHPSMIGRSQDQIEGALKFLIDYGFDITDAFKILPVTKSVYQHNKKNIVNILELLRGYKIPDKDLMQVVSSVPEILDIKNRKILTDAFSRLGEMFMYNDLVNVVVKWPGILLVDLDEVQSKFKYIMETMNMKYTQLLRSNVLSHPLQHIKTRHLFLARAGLFEMPDKNKNTAHVQNPSVKGMMDCTDEEFVSKFGGGMTLADYQTFSQVLILEDNLAEDEDDDDDLGALGYKKGR